MRNVKYGIPLPHGFSGFLSPSSPGKLAQYEKNTVRTKNIPQMCRRSTAKWKLLLQKHRAFRWRCGGSCWISKRCYHDKFARLAELWLRNGGQRMRKTVAAAVISRLPPSRHQNARCFWRSFYFAVLLWHIWGMLWVLNMFFSYCDSCQGLWVTENQKNLLWEPCFRIIPHGCVPWSAPGCCTGNGGKLSNSWFDGLTWLCLAVA